MFLELRHQHALALHLRGQTLGDVQGFLGELCGVPYNLTDVHYAGVDLFRDGTLLLRGTVDLMTHIADGVDRLREGERG